MRSVQTRPAPCCLISRRKGKLVCSSIGARVIGWPCSPRGSGFSITRKRRSGLTEERGLLGPAEILARARVHLDQLADIDEGGDGDLEPGFQGGGLVLGGGSGPLDR